MGGTKLLEEFNFQAGGNGTSFLSSGFSDVEQHYTWGLAPLSVLKLPLPKAAEYAILVLHIAPFQYGDVRSLPLTIVIGERVVYESDLAGDSVVGIAVEDKASRATSCCIEFRCAKTPSPREAGLVGEERHLSFRISRAWVFACADPWSNIKVHKIDNATLGAQPRSIQPPDRSPGQLLAAFESLGQSCDFGLVQREVGIEPLGLLRFAGTQTIQIFLGLINAFAGIGAAGNVKPYVPDSLNEYWVHETTYDLRYHTFISPSSASPEQIIAREGHRLPWLARKLMEDVQNGEKIFLLRRPELVTEAEAIAVWAALNVLAANTLLYLNVIPGRPIGTIDRVGPRLLHGIISGAPGDVVPSIASWLEVCTNAYEAVHSGA